MKARIAICTAKRPKMLEACIASIQNQQIPEQWEVDILVVENDIQPFCEDIVSNLDKSHLAINYMHEPNKGIPIARNAAIDKSLQDGINWLIFIDDDEVAEPLWLDSFLTAPDIYPDAKVFHGPVNYIYPEDCPTWFDKREKQSRPTGDVILTASTNNVMFNLSICQSPLNLRFDESMRFTGGSDTDFFFRASDNGVTIVWINDALVSEEIIEDRLTYRWQLQRAFRVASNATFIHKKRKGVLYTLKRTGYKSVCRIIYSFYLFLILPFMFLSRKEHEKIQRVYFKAAKSFVSATGALSGFTPWKPQPYKVIQGM